MRQRNDTGHVVDVMAWPTDDHPDLRPFTAGPGQVEDYPFVLGGWTPLHEPDRSEAGEDAAPPAAAESAAAGSPAKPTRTRSRSAALAAEGSDS